MFELINNNHTWGIGLFNRFILLCIKHEQFLITKQISFVVKIWTFEVAIALSKRIRNANKIENEIKEGFQNPANNDASA